MKIHRHVHPHLDPRQPRNQSEPGTNPPVFAWKGDIGSVSELLVAEDADFRRAVLHQAALADPLFLPATALAPGVYYWKWRQEGGAWSETFSFRITSQAAVVEVPEVSDWLTRFGTSHPRILLRGEGADTLAGLQPNERWDEVRQAADALLKESHQIAEPERLPDRRTNYAAFREVFGRVLWESRAFVAGARLLGLAFVLTGKREYARAACERMASICRWDPEGSSHLAHNDEAHMSVIWNGPMACDWVWNEFTTEERRVVLEQFRRRGLMTFEHMHDRGAYGISRFDSHAGREIVFLAVLALVFHDEIPEAQRWLEWLRPVLCGIWPVWAGDDGAWAEGPSYGLAYVTIMTMFASALNHGAGVNLYQRPFWRGHAEWRQWCVPAYAEWIGFGDHSERWRGTWEEMANLVETIGREYGAPELAPLVQQYRDEAATCAWRGGIAPVVSFNPQNALFGPLTEGKAERKGSDSCLKVFPAAGWAAVRTDLLTPARDIALIFRSSPFGSISHSHAGNNDFILHAGGRVLAMPSGYYDGYGSNHHANWVWHTKSHNCLTLSDAGQIMRSHVSRGAVEKAQEDADLVYFRGTADSSYADRASRCRRHVVYIKAQGVFFMLDEFVALPGMVSAPQWNIHSWSRFAVEAAARRFELEREGARLEGHFLYHRNSFFTQTEGWEPPPLERPGNEQWHLQHHLRFTPGGLCSALDLGVILAVGLPGEAPARVVTALEDGVESAVIGESDRILLADWKGRESGKAATNLATLCVAGRTYRIDAEAGLLG